MLCLIIERHRNHITCRPVYVKMANFHVPSSNLINYYTGGAAGCRDISRDHIASGFISTQRVDNYVDRLHSTADKYCTRYNLTDTPDVEIVMTSLPSPLFRCCQKKNRNFSVMLIVTAKQKCSQSADQNHKRL